MSEKQPTPTGTRKRKRRKDASRRRAEGDPRHPEARLLHDMSEDEIWAKKRLDEKVDLFDQSDEASDATKALIEARAHFAELSALADDKHGSGNVKNLSKSWMKLRLEAASDNYDEAREAFMQEVLDGLPKSGVNIKKRIALLAALDSREHGALVGEEMHEKTNRDLKSQNSRWQKTVNWYKGTRGYEWYNGLSGRKKTALQLGVVVTAALVSFGAAGAAAGAMFGVRVARATHTHLNNEAGLSTDDRELKEIQQSATLRNAGYEDYKEIYQSLQAKNPRRYVDVREAVSDIGEDRTAKDLREYGESLNETVAKSRARQKALGITAVSVVSATAAGWLAGIGLEEKTGRTGILRDGVEPDIETPDTPTPPEGIDPETFDDLPEDIQEYMTEQENTIAELEQQLEEQEAINQELEDNLEQSEGRIEELEDRVEELEAQLEAAEAPTEFEQLEGHLTAEQVQAFDIPKGSGGEALMNRLHISPREWYGFQDQLLKEFPNDFYRMADGNVGLAYPGELNPKAVAFIAKEVGIWR
jgi:hypothetical protein